MPSRQTMEGAAARRSINHEASTRNGPTMCPAQGRQARDAEQRTWIDPLARILEPGDETNTPPPAKSPEGREGRGGETQALADAQIPPPVCLAMPARCPPHDHRPGLAKSGLVERTLRSHFVSEAMVHPRAMPALAASSTTRALGTGREPGSPMQTGHTFTFGRSGL